MREALFGKDHPEYARSLRNLATLYKDLGRWEQELECRQRALEVDQAVFEGNRPELANDLYNMGVALSNMA